MRFVRGLEALTADRKVLEGSTGGSGEVERPSQTSGRGQGTLLKGQETHSDGRVALPEGREAFPKGR